MDQPPAALSHSQTNQTVATAYGSCRGSSGLRSGARPLSRRSLSCRRPPLPLRVLLPQRPRRQGATSRWASHPCGEGAKRPPTHSTSKAVADASRGCGEPNLSTQSNTSLSSRGKPNLRCGRLWWATKQPLVCLLLQLPAAASVTPVCGQRRTRVERHRQHAYSACLSLTQLRRSATPDAPARRGRGRTDDDALCQRLSMPCGLRAASVTPGFVPVTGARQGRGTSCTR